MLKLGKYRLLYKMAQGGMAEIFSANCPDDESLAQQRICIKRIRPEFSDDADFLRMFRQEARFAMALNHPNVVKVFDFDTSAENCFIVMECIDGWDLKKIISAASAIGMPIPIGVAFNIFREILCALEAASAVKMDGRVQTVIHRDISPHNILVSKDGVAKLTDFGIARARGSSRVTRTGMVKGKLTYLSPEQAGGRE
ncbi:MAG: serine/threonine protein kinase [Deltaproteobacteria bacterium]|nr:serine/threonine protein kinase [Deltaproteobacteria bacterium]